jgi:membrane-bound lytic murein transglycosylase D
MKPALRPLLLATAFATFLAGLPGCVTTGPVSEPIPLASAPPVQVSELPAEISAPITAPSNSPLPTEGDVLTSGEVLDRLRARLSTPTCIVGPNNTRWRHKYAGYPQHFADEIEATLPMMLVVLDELERRKMPGEFALIPIVESWYRPEAHSFGGASGMWQMLNETSRNNGATVISGYDGRLSVLESTDAALTYLDKLQSMFNDWRLTAMAYNSGEYSLIHIMSPDELQERSVGHIAYRRPDGLTHGTYEYVSKMRALTCLLAEPERQSIPLISTLPVVHWIRYTMPADVTSLDELARRLDTDPAQLKRFNSGYRDGRIVAGAPRVVLVPASTRARWEAAAQPSSTALASADPATLATPGAAPDADAAARATSPTDEAASADGTTDASTHAPGESDRPSRLGTRMHVVKRGETLATIARRYHLDANRLRGWNHLGRHAIIKPGQKIKLEP